MACFGVFAVARPVMRAGGYLAWLANSKVIDGGHLVPTQEEISEAIEERKDALAVNVIGPALVISGTLTNGLSGFLAP